MRNAPLVATLAIAGLFAGQALATPITITPASSPCTSNETAASNEYLYINTCFGTSFTKEPGAAYKQDVGAGSDVGAFAAYYSTSFANTSLEPEDADIVWDGPGFFDCSAAKMCILAVKDGNQEPAYYFFDLFDFGWDGKMTLQLRDFWVGNGAISHVSIWGTDGPDFDVPEPGTLGLLGLGLAGLGFGLRRRRNA